MKRTLLVTGLLAATLAHADETKEEYMQKETGPNQKKLNELCLKVNPMQVGWALPHETVVRNIGLEIDANAPIKEALIAVNSMNECNDGYIKIMTTAPLRSKANAPIGL